MGLRSWFLFSRHSLKAVSSGAGFTLGKAISHLWQTTVGISTHTSWILWLFLQKSHQRLSVVTGANDCALMCCWITNIVFPTGITDVDAPSCQNSYVTVKLWHCSLFTQFWKLLSKCSHAINDKIQNSSFLRLLFSRQYPDMPHINRLKSEGWLPNSGKVTIRGPCEYCKSKRFTTPQHTQKKIPAAVRGERGRYHVLVHSLKQSFCHAYWPFSHM